MSKSENIANNAFDFYTITKKHFNSPREFWNSYAYGYMRNCHIYDAENCKEFVKNVYEAENFFLELAKV